MPHYMVGNREYSVRNAELLIVFDGKECLATNVSVYVIHIERRGLHSLDSVFCKESSNIVVTI